MITIKKSTGDVSNKISNNIIEMNCFLFRLYTTIIPPVFLALHWKVSPQKVLKMITTATYPCKVFYQFYKFMYPLFLYKARAIYLLQISIWFCFSFLVDTFEYLNNHFKVEGLFRKSGSVGRQKVLRVSLSVSTLLIAFYDRLILTSAANTRTILCLFL